MIWASTPAVPTLIILCKTRPLPPLKDLNNQPPIPTPPSVPFHHTTGAIPPPRPTQKPTPLPSLPLTSHPAFPVGHGKSCAWGTSGLKYLVPPIPSTFQSSNPATGSPALGLVPGPLRLMGWGRPAGRSAG